MYKILTETKEEKENLISKSLNTYTKKSAKNKFSIWCNRPLTSQAKNYEGTSLAKVERTLDLPIF